MFELRLCASDMELDALMSHPVIITVGDSHDFLVFIFNSFAKIPHQRENSLISYFCVTKCTYFCITCMPNLNCNCALKNIIVLDHFYEK